jgi:phage terminase large subunit-like protein
MMLGGRGAGKTRAGAEWVRARIEAPSHQHPSRRIALIGETFAAALSRSGDWRRQSL